MVSQKGGSTVRYPPAARVPGFLTLVVGVALMTPAGARAAAPVKYTAQALIKLGDKIGDPPSTTHDDLEVGTLNDSGQLTFVTFGSRGGAADLLVQYDNGKFIPVIWPSDPGPIGKWPDYGIENLSVSMNGKGNTAFAVRRLHQLSYLGTFLWEAKTRQFTPLGLPGMAATGELTFDTIDSGRERAAINNSDEVAFPARLRDATGRVVGEGIFFHGRDGKLQPVALPGQPGPDGVPLVSAFYANVNDAGRVAFLARRPGDTRPSGYVWESGTLTAVAVVGADLPGGGTIAEVSGAWVNNTNRSILVEIVLNHSDTGPHALYLWSNGTLAPVVVPGKEMPGGGRFTTLQYFGNPSSSVSFPNDLGQHAFFGRIVEENKSHWAAYLMDADGNITPILKTGDKTEVGTITNVGDLNGIGLGIGLNNKGQVAVGATVANAPPMILLLTPAGP
jgi:hypothetical protein